MLWKLSLILVICRNLVPAGAAANTFLVHVPHIFSHIGQTSVGSPWPNSSFAPIPAWLAHLMTALIYRSPLLGIHDLTASG